VAVWGARASRPPRSASRRTLFICGIGELGGDRAAIACLALKTIDNKGRSSVYAFFSLSQRTGVPTPKLAQKAAQTPALRAATKGDVLDRMNRMYRIRLGPRDVIVLFFRNPVHPVHPVNFLPKVNDSDGLQSKILAKVLCV